MSYLLLAVNNSHGRSLSKTSCVLDQWLNRVSSTCWYGTLSREGLDSLKDELMGVVTRAVSIQFFWLHKHDFHFIDQVGKVQSFEKAWAPIGKPLADTKPPQYRPHEVIVRDLAIVAGLVHDVGKAKQDTQRVYRGLQRSDLVRHEIPSALWFARWAALGRISMWDDLQWTLAGAWPADSLVRILYQSVISHHGLPRPDIREGPVTAGYLLHRLDKAAGSSGVISLVPHQSDEGRPVFSDLWLQSLERHYAALASLTSEGQLDRTRGEGNAVATAEEYYYFAHRLLLMLADAAESAFESNPDAQTEKRGRVLYPDTADDPLDDGAVYAKSSRRVPLVDHLRGVGDFARKAAYFLFLRSHPRINRTPAVFHELPQKGSAFYWQNRSRYCVKAVEQTLGAFENRGFFGCVTAQTGSGKTRGCYGILSALSGDRPRFTLGLGYGALAVQSAATYRHDIGLAPSECAVMVGRRHQRYLQETLSDRDSSSTEGSDAASGPDGEAFLKTLADFESDLEGGSVASKATDIHRLLFREGRGAKGRLIDTPIIVMTIDHISGAMNPSRGSFLPAMLRVATTDLIIDEVDSFAPSDLHGLARLVYLSGLFGRKVLLSSATLPSELATHLHSMYAKGYRAFQLASGAPDYGVGFFNDTEATGYARILVAEQARERAPAGDTLPDSSAQLLSGQFSSAFNQFHAAMGHFDQHIGCHTAVVADSLKDASLNHQRPDDGLLPRDLVTGLLADMRDLAAGNHEVMTGVPISFGVLRLTHVRDVQSFLRSIRDDHLEDDQWIIRFQPLHGQLADRVRNQVQGRFSSYLDRKSVTAFWDAFSRDHSGLVAGARADQKGVLIVMVATSVVEVGVDYDFDWALSEPTTLSALIQLAGRCLRHRRHKVGDSPVRLLPFTLEEYFGATQKERFSRAGLAHWEDKFLLDLKPPKKSLRRSSTPSSSPLSRLDSCRPASAAFLEDSQRLTLSNQIRLSPPVITADCVERMQIDNVFGRSAHREIQLGHFLEEVSPFATSRYLLPFRAQNDSDDVIAIDRSERGDTLRWASLPDLDDSQSTGPSSNVYSLPVQGLLITERDLGWPDQVPDQISTHIKQGALLHYNPALGVVWSKFQLYRR